MTALTPLTVLTALIVLSTLTVLTVLARATSRPHLTRQEFHVHPGKPGTCRGRTPDPSGTHPADQARHVVTETSVQTAEPTPVSAPAAPQREIFVARSTTAQSTLTRARRRLTWPLGIYTTPLAILIGWEALALTKVLGSNYAPAPTAIAGTAKELWNQGVLGPDLLISLQRATIGLALGLAVGISTGLLGGLLRSGEYLFNGVVQIFNTIPLLAVLPIMIVWFGIGELPKILIIAFGAFVPMYLNLFAAIRGIDQRLIEMAQTVGAGRWRLIWRVLLPGALPGFLVGLRFALAYSILGLVAAETVNANQGLGFLITQGQTYLQTNQVFVGLAIYSIFGLLADQVVRVLERALLQWRPSYEAL